jgi:hypothetical protein
MKQRLLSILKAEKVFDKSQNYFMGRTDRFERALAREKRLRILKKQHNWNYEEFKTATELVGEPGPYGLHDSMFKVRHPTADVGACILINPGHARRAGNAGAARKVAYTGRGLQDYWMLCTD